MNALFKNMNFNIKFNNTYIQKNIKNNNIR